MTISIALATYNGETFLLEQLESLAQQTRPPDEIVVSDDGSTDNTRAIVREFASRAPFAVVLLEQRERLGFADNFLAAAKACSSDLIAFCDQDDVWLPKKLEKAEQTLREAEAGLFIHQSVTVTRSLERLNLLDQSIPLRGVVQPLTYDAFDRGYGHCMVFRRELVHIGSVVNRPIQPRGTTRLSHDHFVMQMASLFSRMVISDEEYTLYRQHSTNAFGAGITEQVKLLDYATPAVSDYLVESSFYQQLESYLNSAEIDHTAKVLGGLVSGATVKRELKARSQRLDARMRTYTAATLFGRVKSWIESLQAGLTTRSLTARKLSLSGGKDLVFGVLGRRPSKR